ncbi:SDR family oxidoreductase [Actinocorallia populi]|uniref:SDR family oxidoreductase n=1 Tax=Actinocorallia populi TaxID=2079200 RepID=UPI000D087298|nr:SDR family oxidoreductase [Actinocorallia populi]
MSGMLNDRVVLVTAAAGAGLGYATALKCAQEGARLVISDVHERRLAEAAEKLAEAAGVKPVAIPCDVSDTAQVDALVERAVEQAGRIDVLVNNAGMGGDQAVVDMTDAEWDKVIDISLTSVFRVTRAVLRHMLPRESGVIVNLASVSGWRAQERQAHYAAAKAGVMAFTRCVAMEAAPAGVRVNAVAPSLAMHPFLEKTVSAELLAELTAKEAFGRAATPEEVANVVLFLASDLSSYMTGEVVSVSNQHP